MKRFSIICAMVGCMSIASCNKWLDIMPEETTLEEQLFSTYSGYRASLNGIYQSMASDDLYGREMSWGFASALSQYMNNAETVSYIPYYTHAERYDFQTDEVRALGEAIWQKSYNIIANCNNFIQHIESADKSMFPDESDKFEMEMMTGEAYAVRAFLHFDLLRLFGPSPAVGMDEPAIPYNDYFPDKFFSRLTTREVLKRVIDDLEHAYPLVELYDGPKGFGDTYMSIEKRFLSIDPQKVFFAARGYRLSSTAIKALLARVYMYAGNLEKANEYASYIYKTFMDPAHYFFYTTYTPNDLSGTRSHKMESEVIFGSYRKQLAIYYAREIVYNPENPYVGSYYLKNVDYMYQTFRNDMDDYRFTKLITAVTPGLANKRYASSRYLAKTNALDKENFLIPIIRMSEMRYIMAEYLAKDGNDLPGAIDILNDHRVKRGCMARSLPATLSQADFMEELLYDQWKEFTMEGQHFFQCKRLNIRAIRTGATSITMSPDKYALPIPYSETSVTSN